MIIEKDCEIHACNRMNFSSNINEVIRAVLNLYDFFTKTFRTQQKLKKQKKLQSTKSTKSTKTQPTKSTKRYKRTRIKSALKNI